MIADISRRRRQLRFRGTIILDYKSAFFNTPGSLPDRHRLSHKLCLNAFVDFVKCRHLQLAARLYGYYWPLFERISLQGVPTSQPMGIPPTSQPRRSDRVLTSLAYISDYNDTRL